MAKLEVQVVNCYSLNIRAGAGTSHKVVQWAQKGEKYTSSKQSNGWYYIDAKKGWASGSYIKSLKNLDEAAKPPAKVTPPKKEPAKPAPATSKPKSSGIDYDAVSKVLAGGATAKTAGQKLKVLEKDARIPTVAEQNPKLIPWVDDPNMNTFGSEDFDVTVSDYELDYSHIMDNMDIIRRNFNIRGENYGNIRKNMFDRFNRFKTPFPDYHLSKTFSHVFFTRPDLNLLTDSGDALNGQFSKDPLFSFLYNNNSKLIESLTTKLSASHDFHPYLSNAANSFELSDEFIKTIEHGETFTGWKIQYGRHNIESNTAGQFAINYQDDADFNIYKTHKAWTEYISRVYRGDATPNRDYIKKRILDYAASVYYFVCGPDGETILFWSKYFGVFPLNTPASAGSWARGTSARLPEFNINYAYAMKEDFSPLSLAEFNMNSSTDFEYRKIYEPEIAATGRTMSGAPFVATGTDANGSAVYKLKFRT